MRQQHQQILNTLSATLEDLGRFLFLSILVFDVLVSGASTSTLSGEDGLFLVTSDVMGADSVASVASNAVDDDVMRIRFDSFERVESKLFISN